MSIIKVHSGVNYILSNCAIGPHKDMAGMSHHPLYDHSVDNVAGHDINYLALSGVLSVRNRFAPITSA